MRLVRAWLAGIPCTQPLGAVLQAMRVMRLVRVMKLFKHVEGRDPEDARSRAGNRMSMLSPQVQQSRVGQKLSELTTRRVVLGVLTMVFVLPYWDIANGVYGGSPNFEDVGLLSLHNQGLLDSTGPVFRQALEVCATQACEQRQSAMKFASRTLHVHVI